MQKILINPAKAIDLDYKREVVRDLRNGDILIKDNKGNIQRYVLAEEKTPNRKPKRQSQPNVSSKGAEKKPRAANIRRTMNVSNDSINRQRSVVVRAKNLTATEIHAVIAKGLHDGRLRKIKNAFGALPSKYDYVTLFFIECDRISHISN